MIRFGTVHLLSTGQQVDLQEQIDARSDSPSESRRPSICVKIISSTTYLHDQIPTTPVVVYPVYYTYYSTLVLSYIPLKYSVSPAQQLTAAVQDVAAEGSPKREPPWIAGILPRRRRHPRHGHDGQAGQNRTSFPIGTSHQRLSHLPFLLSPTVGLHFFSLFLLIYLLLHYLLSLYFDC